MHAVRSQPPSTASSERLPWVDAGTMDNEFSIALGHCVANGHLYDLTEQQRARHIYTIGRTGTGKSTLQRSLILQDIVAGRGVCLIDPHGDNAKWLASCIPRHRMNEVIYFDAADRMHPIGLNPFTDSYDPDTRELIASEILALFKGLFRNSWGEWLEYLLKHTLRALLERKQGMVSLLSIQRMLEDTDYRELILRDLRDPALKRFWEEYINRLPERQRLERISSTINKTGKFELSTVLRNIVGQTKSGFSIQDVLDNKKILLVNLSKGQIGDDNANFLGSLIVSMIVGQIMRRGAIPEEERVPHHLFIDEFQNFTTDAFAEIVSEARKYGLRLAVAHQTFDQVPEKVLNQILKNAEVLTAFSISFEDADRLSRSFRPLRSEALSNSQIGQFWVRTTQYEPTLVHGFAPDQLDGFECGSFERAKRSSRWRYARRREDVERKMARWY